MSGPRIYGYFRYSRSDVPAPGHPGQARVQALQMACAFRNNRKIDTIESRGSTPPVGPEALPGHGILRGRRNPPPMRLKAIRLLIAAAIVLAAVPGWAGAPTDSVREYTDAVVKVLEDPSLKVADRRTAVRKLANEAFDIQEAARRALGQHWQQRTPAEREEFVGLFADLLERTYIAKIDMYGGERLKFTDEKIDGENAIVRGKVTTKQGADVPVEARMHKKGDRWLIYDVAIENISLISNYRAQFDRIIRTSSYGDLVKRLRNKGEFLQEKDRRAGG